MFREEEVHLQLYRFSWDVFGDENERDVMDGREVFFTSRARVGFSGVAADETRREGRAVRAEMVEREYGEWGGARRGRERALGRRGEAVGGVDEEEECRGKRRRRRR